ncbi:hypothetical protein LCGC14_2252920 [marine sediment metagenome]|uniref:Uncharacterized protein n=1 Tax=marine sediment metagenome TaxID=412755 RepID=A0A0F9FEG7_9ZZZZ
MKELSVLICAVVFAVLFMGAGSSDTDKKQKQMRQQISEYYHDSVKGQ